MPARAAAVRWLSPLRPLTRLHCEEGGSDDDDGADDGDAAGDGGEGGCAVGSRSLAALAAMPAAASESRLSVASSAGRRGSRRKVQPSPTLRPSP